MSDLMKSKINALQVRSKAMKLKELMPDIDRKVSEGVSHGDVIAALAEEGMIVSLPTFRTNLYRYRNQIRHTCPASDAATTKTGQEKSTAIINPIYVPPEIMPPSFSDGDFEQALDPKSRDRLGDHYLTKRKPIIRSKK